jgi:hypothetical protein
MPKEYKLHFRRRDEDNKLHDEIKTTQANSKKAAIQYGKSLEQDKYWFMGLWIS